MSKWKECKLGDVITIIGGGTPKTSISEYWNGDIPWLSVVDFNTGNKFVEKTEKTITQNGLQNSSTKMLNVGDVIISARGTVGAMAVLKKPMAFNQSCYGLRSIPNITSQDFLYYLTKDSILCFQQIAHGGVFDTITKETFDAIDILLPSLSEQKAIATVLSSLDNKIDLLHRQNKTLETMAETLFRQWFIEEAQEDWEEYKLSDVALHHTAIVKPQSKAYTLFQHFSLPAFDAGRIPITELGSEILSHKYEVKKNSILVSKLNPRISRIWAVLENLPENSICSTEFQVFTSKDRNMFGFLYFLFKSDNAIAALEMAASGTSGSHQRVSPKDMLNIRFDLPNLEKALSFSQIAKHYLNKFDQNLSQIQILEKIRDNLLPKLMSGEIRVHYE